MMTIKEISKDKPLGPRVTAVETLDDYQLLITWITSLYSYRNSGFVEMMIPQPVFIPIGI